MGRRGTSRASAPGVLLCVGGLFVALGGASCTGEVRVEECRDAVSSTIVSGRLEQNAVRRIDLVLAIDNSRSMADKQQILALAVPDLVQGLVNPPCVDLDTGEVASEPAGPLEACPAGTRRTFDPVTDIHVGIVSSSLGGRGSDACSSTGAGKQSNDDKGRLIARLDPAEPGDVPTYQGLGFLAWDPAQKATPPGESDVLVDTAVDAGSGALVPALRDMVIGVGQIGCGYESQLESWYRFLVDPTPAESLTLDEKDQILLEGVDEQLLAQRKGFLRPDSLLAIVMLTDENDCSIRETGQLYYMAQQKASNGSSYHLPRARAVCETDPNDPCCFSCAQKGPTGGAGDPVCPADPACTDANGDPVFLDELADNTNVRCWDQKRRFGIDFLHPTSRYVDALRSPTVVDRTGQVVQNPLFTDLDPSDSASVVRSSSLVLLAGIVGVPWQDIARTNKSGIPDLQSGLDQEGAPRGGFKSAEEMSALLPGKDYTTWDLVLGAPESYPSEDALPRDPLMWESIDPRTGTTPITGEPLVTSAEPLANKINGHEQTSPARDDLQLACIFPLVQVDAATGEIAPAKRDCSIADLAGCDCVAPDNDSPLCEVNPATGERTDQVRAKAYPGLRELTVLRDLGQQGIVASVCPAQLTKLEASDFGYRPAIASILDRLAVSTLGRCLGRALPADDLGRVPCKVVVARDSDGACNCDVPGRAPLAAGSDGLVKQIQDDNPGASFDCFCEVVQLENTAKVAGPADCANKYGQPDHDLCACQYTPVGAPVFAGDSPVNGWCYVDPPNGVGDPSIVASCAAGDERLIRFVGGGEAEPGASLFMTCDIEERHAGGAACR